jgi:AcrR family transcriptional regulator
LPLGRTRRLLGDALVALLAERRYDAITVQAIIARANGAHHVLHALPR